MTISDKLPAALAGVSCVLVAPYRDGTGEPDADMTEQLVRRIDAAGVHAITVLGNTAEVFQLRDAERRSLVAAAARGRDQSALIVGAAGPAGACLNLIEHAAELGYDAAMVHDPPDPLAGERGIVRLFHDLADRSPLPIVLYARTPRLGRVALADVVAHPNVVAVKYARHDLAVLGALMTDSDTRSACTWICGLAESMVLPMRGLGVVGFTSGVANLRPDLALAVWEASRDGDLDALAARVAPLMPFEAMRTRAGGRHNVAVVKAALALEGLDAGDVRPPCDPLGAAELDELRAVLGGFPAVREHVAG